MGRELVRDGNRSNLHRIGSKYHLLLYFNLNSNTNKYIFLYEYKKDVLDLDFYSDIYLIQLKVHIT